LKTETSEDGIVANISSSFNTPPKMKIKTSELQGAALDWAVAKCMTGGELFQSGRVAHAVVLDSVGSFHNLPLIISAIISARLTCTVTYL